MITTFVSGPGPTTLPLYIFGQIKRGVTPETNAVAAMVLRHPRMLLIAAAPGWPASVAGGFAASAGCGASSVACEGVAGDAATGGVDAAGCAERGGVLWRPAGDATGADRRLR